MGIPCALSSSVLKDWTLFGLSPLELMIYTGSGILIPLGGLFAVILTGWKWGSKNAVAELEIGAESAFAKLPILRHYFHICFKYVAPALILIVFLNAMGIFSL